MTQLHELISNVNSRFELWGSFVQHYDINRVAEIGVYKGEFAKEILNKCPRVSMYYMIDPWRNLENWNKPANTSDLDFEKFYNKTIAETEFAGNRRKILRGKTLEVINRIPDNSLDLVYVDGDHTLKGITIDLINAWGKVNEEGFIAGDDFCANIWQHAESYEPTLVFPYTVHFAEAMDVKLFALPYNQFLIAKGQKGFEFINLTDFNYQDASLLPQLKISQKEKIKKKNLFSRILERMKF